MSSPLPGIKAEAGFPLVCVLCNYRESKGFLLEPGFLGCYAGIASK